MIALKNAELVQGQALKFTDVIDGVAKADAWGEPDAAHGAVTRYAAGHHVPLHTHTYDMKIVVIAGTLLHGDAQGRITRLGPGSYCFIPDGQKHTLGCEKDEDCLFYEEQPGKFDIKAVK